MSWKPGDDFYGPRWISVLPRKQYEALSEGESIILDGKIYRVCSNCGCVIQYNKRFFGSLHVCNDGK